MKMTHASFTVFNEIQFSSENAGEYVIDCVNLFVQTKAELHHRDSFKYGFVCLPTLLRPESKGSITLRSTDPFDYPVIRANYLDKQEDMELLIRGSSRR